MNLQEKYNEWRKTKHGEEAFREACAIAAKLQDRGFTHYSADAISHIVRFHRHLKHGTDDQGFKMNDHHTAYMARELMRKPGLAGFFETRRIGRDRA